MNFSVNRDLLIDRISSFSPDQHQQERIAAMYSAAVTSGDEEILTLIVEKAKKKQLPYEFLYEIVLQSYLFLGFPRMLIAAEHLAEAYKYKRTEQTELPLSCEMVGKWLEDGRQLCRQIYRENFDPLRKKVLTIAPEIFQWMLLEGYGKVLSRDTLNIQERELSIVGFLMMENRPRQLHSHLLGAVHVGTSKELIRQIVTDIGDAAGDGFTAAKTLCEQLEI